MKENFYRGITIILCVVLLVFGHYIDDVVTKYILAFLVGPLLVYGFLGRKGKVFNLNNDLSPGTYLRILSVPKEADGIFVVTEDNDGEQSKPFMLSLDGYKIEKEESNECSDYGPLDLCGCAFKVHKENSSFRLILISKPVKKSKK